MTFDIITLFPDIIEAYFRYGVLSRAVRNGLLEIRTHQLRDYSLLPHQKVDDPIFGTGRGMLFRPEPLDAVLKVCKQKQPSAKVVYMTPQGVSLNNRLARELAAEPGLIVISSRYEGVDARWIRKRVDIEISTGDYVLTGGEVPALALVDSVSRFLKGTIETDSVEEDSFENGLLEYEHFTEPLIYEGEEVPKVLRSGNHKRVEDFRLAGSLKKTYFNRPDLFLDFEVPIKESLTKNAVRSLQKRNQQISSYLKEIQKISKEWSDVRRAQKR